MKTLVVANWKMNPQTLEGAKLLFNSVKRGVKNVKNVKVVICPPFLYISNLKSESRGPSKMGGRGGRVVVSNFKLGAQDVFFEQKGAFTGEISPLMLKNLRCEYVIIGHSERRKFGETDEMINKKIKAVIEVKLKPILCIGETEKDYNPPTARGASTQVEEGGGRVGVPPFGRAPRKEGKTFQVLRNQIKKALNNLTIKQFNNLILAYEPVWAIGTGNPCNPSEAKKIALFLRKIFRKNQILYGGSVNSENAARYTKEAGFTGLLVGGASLNPQGFVKIVKTVNKT